MKRTGFKRPKYEDYVLDTTPRAPLRRSPIKKRATVAKRRKLPASELPEWLRKIPCGSHGSTPIQKRAWKYISDMVRKQDFETYGGKCVSCPRILNDWTEGDCAHFIPWSVANGLMKFNVKNLALSCKPCNGMGGSSIGHAFGEELKRRYGPDILLELAMQNAKYHGTKLYDADVIALVAYFYNLDNDKT